MNYRELFVEVKNRQELPYLVDILVASLKDALCFRLQYADLLDQTIAREDVHGIASIAANEFLSAAMRLAENGDDAVLIDATEVYNDLLSALNDGTGSMLPYVKALPAGPQLPVAIFEELARVERPTLAE